MEKCIYCNTETDFNNSDGLPICSECLLVMDENTPLSSRPGESLSASPLLRGEMRFLSLTRGLIVPEHEKDCSCGCHAFENSMSGQIDFKTRGPEKNAHIHVSKSGFHLPKVQEPSLFELDLARQPHRWKAVRDLTADFLRNLAREVTKFEVALLEAAGLPGVDEVRAFVLSEKYPPIPLQRGKQIDEDILKRVLSEFIGSVCGSGGKLNFSDLPIYPFYVTSAFNIGLEKTRDSIEKSVDNPELLPAAVVADADNLYLGKIISEGLKRVRTQIGTKYKKQILKIIEDGVSEGLSPLVIARDLHNAVGEGQMWYWNRLARSEVSIALDAAFVNESMNDGIPYEKWSTSANPCPICAALDGKIWRVGEGPRVVYDTHPHCLCVKYPYILHPESVQSGVDHGDFAYI